MMNLDLEKMNIEKKENAMIGDIIVVFVIEKNTFRMFYGKVFDIVPDVKKGWWIFKFKSLTPVCQDISWILRESQFNGEEFTINNVPHVIVPVDTTKFKDVVEQLEKLKKEIPKSKRKGGLTLVK